LPAASGKDIVPRDAHCVFCKIIAGQIPSYKIYEDEQVFAFLDIGPIVRGHALVISKGHYPSLLETPAPVAAAIGARLPMLARAVQAATGTPACHVLVNNGAEASQSVRHLHFHILPRFANDGYKLNWDAGKIDASNAQELVSGIARALKELASTP
jgi:histidine triad (HIT) family protein